VLDAGDVIALLRQLHVDLVLSGHRHVPYVWPVAGMFIVHSGTVSTLRVRGFPHPSYNLIRVEDNRISVELRIPEGEGRSLGEYPATGPKTSPPATRTSSSRRRSRRRWLTTSREQAADLEALARTAARLDGPLRRR
jgi:hypothetical protein